MLDLFHSIPRTDAQKANYERIKDVIDTHFYHWLINPKQHESEKLTDGLGESGISEGLALNEESRKDNQRLLLAVEKKGEISRTEAKKKIAADIKDAQVLLSRQMRKKIKAMLGDKIKTVQQVNIPSAFPDLIDALFTPSATFRTYGDIVEAIPQMPQQVTRYAEMNSVKNKKRERIELQSAIGHLGPMTVKQVFPAMILKKIIKVNCEHFPLFGRKLWSFTLTQANAQAALLKEAQYGKNEGDEFQGIIVGLLWSIGHSIVHQVYSRAFEEAKQQCLQNLRNQSRFDLYNGMLEAKADPELLIETLMEYAEPVNKYYIDSIHWGERAKPIVKAIEESYLSLPLNTRSPLGVTLEQARAYSKFEVLHKAKRFTDRKHVYPYLDGAGMTKKHINTLIRTNLRTTNAFRY